MVFPTGNLVHIIKSDQAIKDIVCSVGGSAHWDTATCAYFIIYSPDQPNPSGFMQMHGIKHTLPSLARKLNGVVIDITPHPICSMPVPSTAVRL